MREQVQLGIQQKQIAFALGISPAAVLAGADLGDSVLDWVAVTLGAWAAIATWRGRGRRVAALLASGAVIVWTGVSRRHRR